MNKKLIVVSVGLSAVLLITAVPAFAVDGTPGAMLKAVVKGTLQKMKGARAAVGRGTLSGINGTTLTITKDAKSYTILTDSTTMLRRRFGAKATLSEFSVGDSLVIIGKWTDDAQTSIQAKYVRDLSVQKRNGTFFGVIDSVTSSGFVLKADKRGMETVTTSSSTKFVNRKGQTITLAQIKIGDRVRVKGLWDNKLNTITEVSGVKDYNLPLPTGSNTSSESAKTSQ